MAPVNYYHYRTKQISSATPLWGATSPEAPFMIEPHNIYMSDSFIIDDNGVAVGTYGHTIPNPQYHSPINLPADKIGFFYKSSGEPLICHAQSEVNVGAGIYNSLVTMEAVLHYWLPNTYIEDGRLHLISDVPLEILNHPDYDFAGTLGFEFCDE